MAVVARWVEPPRPRQRRAGISRAPRLSRSVRDRLDGHPQILGGGPPPLR